LTSILFVVLRSPNHANTFAYRLAAVSDRHLLLRLTEQPADRTVTAGAGDKLQLIRTGTVQSELEQGICLKESDRVSDTRNRLCTLKIV
jgi:hypothetical protein